MRIRLICLILTFVSHIDHTFSLRPVRDEYFGYDYPDYSEYRGRRVSQYASPQSRAISDIPGAVAEFSLRQVKQVINWVKCMTSCFFNYLTSNLCTQMFPCIYDCFIGESYVAPEVEKKLRQLDTSGRVTYPAGIGFKTIYSGLRCLRDCAIERPITNWESFVYSIYCVADSCICYRLFGQT